MTIKPRAFAGLLTLALAACNGSAPTPPPAPAAPTEAVAAYPAFAGRIWIRTTPGAARGSLLVFLPDRTLLIDSCFEPYRLSKWDGDSERIRWIEDSIPVEAEVSMPRKDLLILHIAGQDRDRSFVAASVPYVCPDMPR